MSKENQSFDDLMDEFEFEVPGIKPETPAGGVDVILTPEEEAAKAAEDAAAKEAEEAAKANEGKTEEEIESERIAAEEATKAKEEEEEEEVKKQVLEGSSYKDIAQKYIEKGIWSEELAVEDGEGNEILIKDLEEIDEDTFFQIRDAVKALEEEDNKSKFISVEKVDERRKNLIEIIKEGGDLSQIFESPEQVQEYLNPFENLDLDNEQVQERIFLNALMKYNKLDADTAKTVVEKAKKDLTLDEKVKNYVEKYTESFDKFVESKKAEVIASKQEEAKQNKEFKKALQEQFKGFELKDALSRKLANSAVTKADNGDYEIDAIYAEKMENPEEAAELILFLQDKQAYLDYKLQKKVTETHKNVRRTIKLIPKDKTSIKKDDDTKKKEEDEFSFTVEQ